MSAKLKLLKLSKKELIRKSKKYNFNSNGTKSDMVDGLLKNNRNTIGRDLSRGILLSCL